MRKILAVLALFGLVACGGAGNKSESVGASDAITSNASKSAKSEYGERMMSYFVTVDMTVKNRASAKTKITDQVKEIKGYVTEESRRRVVVNIPTDEVSDFIEFLGDEVGTVKDVDKYGKDITESYDEISARLTTLRASRDRYIALLKQASAVDEMLKIEKELERVNSEIQRLELQKSRAENSVDYSKITINLKDYAMIGGSIVSGTVLAVLLLFIIV